MRYKKLIGQNWVNAELSDFEDGDKIQREIISDVWQKSTFNSQKPKPKVTFLNIAVTSVAGIGDYFGIYTLKQGNDFKITAEISDPHGLLTGLTAMNIIIEKVVNQTTVVGDERLNAVIDNGVVTIDVPLGFETTGNFMLTAARQNQGLVYLGLPFEIEFDTIEFDVQRN